MACRTYILVVFADTPDHTAAIFQPSKAGQSMVDVPDVCAANHTSFPIAEKMRSGNAAVVFLTETRWWTCSCG